MLLFAHKFNICVGARMLAKFAVTLAFSCALITEFRNSSSARRLSGNKLAWKSVIVFVSNRFPTAHISTAASHASPCPIIAHAFTSRHFPFRTKKPSRAFTVKNPTSLADWYVFAALAYSHSHASLCSKIPSVKLPNVKVSFCVAHVSCKYRSEFDLKYSYLSNEGSVSVTITMFVRVTASVARTTTAKSKLTFLTKVIVRPRILSAWKCSETDGSYVNT
mmetsp:Transcript_5034/g.17180  ORF Transcript_5034/g.17180 Transcript_5034/m.17180 type:complete len:220 (-) Transcript_5034:277-936(-)